MMLERYCIIPDFPTLSNIAATVSASPHRARTGEDAVRERESERERERERERGTEKERQREREKAGMTERERAKERQGWR